MKWTNERPTVPGWWWMKPHSYSAEIVFVQIPQVQWSLPPVYWRAANECETVLDNEPDNTLWYGPIEPPEVEGS